MNLPMIDQPTGDQPRRPHSYRHINKEIARIGHFYFLSVQNDKRSNHPIRNCNQDISERSRQCLHQDKTVEGKMRPRNLFSLRIADQADRTDPDKSSHPTNKDNQIKPTFPIDGNSCQRSQRHRQIDCQTVKPHSFTTPGGRDHIIADGTAAALTKKEALDFQRNVEKLNKSIGGIKEMTALPDALFIVDVGYHKIAVQEANKLGIPVIGVVDTNHSPDGIDYVIPGNDDSSKAVAIYAAGIADAIIAGRNDSAQEIVEAANEDFVEVSEGEETTTEA